MGQNFQHFNLPRHASITPKAKQPTSPILNSSILKWLYNIMETGIITISDNKKDFTKEKANDSAHKRYLMFQSPSPRASATTRTLTTGIIATFSFDIFKIIQLLSCFPHLNAWQAFPCSRSDSTISWMYSTTYYQQFQKLYFMK